MHQVFIFSSLPLACCSCLFAFWLYFARVSCVRTHTRTWVQISRTRVTWFQILLYTSCYCFCCTKALSFSQRLFLEKKKKKSNSISLQLRTTSPVLPNTKDQKTTTTTETLSSFLYETQFFACLAPLFSSLPLEPLLKREKQNKGN